MWRHRPRNFPTASRYKDTVKAQYRHAQCTIDITTFLSSNSRKNAYAATAAVHLINACVVGISKGNKGKNPWFRTKESVSLSQAAKNERSSGSSRAWEVIIVTTSSLCSLLVFVVVVVVVFAFLADVYIDPSSHWANRDFSY